MSICLIYIALWTKTNKTLIAIPLEFLDEFFAELKIWKWVFHEWRFEFLKEFINQDVLQALGFGEKKKKKKKENARMCSTDHPAGAW